MGVGLVALTKAVSVATDEPRVAVTVTSGFDAPAVAPKKAVFDPAGTVTDPGATSNADESSLESVTAVSAGAGTSSVTRFAA